VCGVAHPLIVGECAGLGATESLRLESEHLGAVSVQVCRPCSVAAAGWCQPDRCPSVVCGGPHRTVRDGDVSAVVPVAAGEADIEMALGYARAMGDGSGGT
jgi:hypothetical protein